MKMGAMIYPATTAGPNCTLGGEIKNSVLFGNSNKGHDGYLGDSVIGEWCNLGAGTSNSNLKNNAGIVNYQISESGENISSGVNKGGLIMGDYSRAAINTSFNTGTTVGVCANIINDVRSKKFIPSFSWGNEIYKLDKVFSDIAAWKKMKNQDISDSEKNILTQLYKQQINK